MVKQMGYESDSSPALRDAESFEKELNGAGIGTFEIHNADNFPYAFDAVRKDLPYDPQKKKPLEVEFEQVWLLRNNSLKYRPLADLLLGTLRKANDSETVHYHIEGKLASTKPVKATA